VPPADEGGARAAEEESVPADDPRPLLFRTLEQAGALVAGTIADQAGLPTPCTGWDVGTLVGHLCGLPVRIAVIGSGGDPDAVPSLRPDLLPEQWAGEFDRAVADARAAWADDAVLDRTVRSPGGEHPGRLVAPAYVPEVVTHSWDLAAATGRAATLDPELGAAALEIARELLPAERAAAAEWFGPVVEVPAGSGPYEQLAAWMGRAPG
jgi:uncharacterized protein (TIGR03086 family)